MTTYDDSASGFPGTQPTGILSRYFFSTDHRTIGLQYLWLALFSVFLGMGLSLWMRIEQVWSGAGISFLPHLGNSPERYAALTILHGSLMVFMVLTAAPQAGFGSYLLPLQIGAREMAFPRLNLLSFWSTAASLCGITAAFLFPAGAGLKLWIACVALFCMASLLTALNFTITALDLRARGMTLPRMPVSAWAWFLTAILSSLIFSILLSACALLLCDQFFGTHFMVPTYAISISGAAPAARMAFWHRLFWFFAQAEVYVAMLPCFGMVTHLLATFARKPVWKERAVVLALCGVGVFGFCVWGQHMFSSGMNPNSPVAFSVLASSLGLPAVILVMSWFRTLWNARIQWTTSMLFASGFVSLFLTGGLSGIFLARRNLKVASASDEFITGHFHLVMGVAATFAILAALFFWFPKFFGPRLNESLGKLHFWLTFAGVYAVFMPMHWLGLTAHSGAFSGYQIPVAPFAAAGSSVRIFIAMATIVTIAAQGIFLFNFVWSLCRGVKTQENNPWRATTLEWNLASRVGDLGGDEPVVYRGAYEFNVSGGAQDFVAQHLAPEQVPKVR
jgi:cytochrome c oxidase subunit I